jgi:hypothetical protein
VAGAAATIDHILDERKNPYPTPMLYISFHAFLDSKGVDCIAWSDIAAGRFDGEINAWAGELHLLGGRQTYLVFHHEMENEEGAPPEGSGTPEDFIAAYWYFRRRIEVVNGVPNLVWVITFMHDTFAPYLKHGGPDRWWPAGSPYGDVADDHLVGVDVYNRNCATTGSGGLSPNWWTRWWDAGSSPLPHTASRSGSSAGSSSASAAAWNRTSAATEPFRRGR